MLQCYRAFTFNLYGITTKVPLFLTLCLVSTKRLHILKKTCQVCLNKRDILVDSRY